MWMLQPHSLKQQLGVNRENVLPLYKTIGVLPVVMVKAKV